MMQWQGRNALPGRAGLTTAVDIATWCVGGLLMLGQMPEHIAGLHEDIEYEEPVLAESKAKGDFTTNFSNILFT